MRDRISVVYSGWFIEDGSGNRAYDIAAHAFVDHTTSVLENAFSKNHSEEYSPVSLAFFVQFVK